MTKPPTLDSVHRLLDDQLALLEGAGEVDPVMVLNNWLYRYLCISMEDPRPCTTLEDLARKHHRDPEKKR